MCAGKRVDKIDFWAGEVRRLEMDIVAARKAAMEAPARTSFFVFFTSQKDAAIAAQTNLHPEDGHSFRVKEAPGPEEVGFCQCFSRLRMFFQCFTELLSGNVGTFSMLQSSGLAGDLGETLQ